MRKQIKPESSESKEARDFRARLNDADYVARLKAGDEGALEELTVWIYCQVPKYIANKYKFNILDAEDLAQDLVFRVRRGLKGFTSQGERSLSNWIFTVIRNRVLTEIDKRDAEADPERNPLRRFYEYEIEVLEYLNRKYPEQEAAILNKLESDDPPEKKPSPERKIALDAFNLLGERFQRILLLREIDDYDTIAEHELADKFQGRLIPEKALRAKVNQLRVLHKRAKDSWSNIIEDIKSGKEVRKRKPS